MGVLQEPLFWVDPEWTDLPSAFDAGKARAADGTKP
jgi:hypothetical protein